MPEEEKKEKLKRGGLQGKIFRLCLMLVVTASIGFAVLGFIVLERLLDRAIESGEQETSTVSELSERSMMEMTNEQMSQLARTTASSAYWEIWIMQHDAITIANQVWDVLHNLDKYEEREILPPSKENKDQLALQLLVAEGVEPTEEELSVARKLANLGPMMKEMIRDNDYVTLDLLITLPSGITVTVDTFSDIKVDKDGNPIPFDGRKRPWYKGATENRNYYLAPPGFSDLLDKADLAFGVPLYDGDELLAVVEGSIFMERIETVLSKAHYGETGFYAVISQDGTLIYSPREDGELKKDPTYQTNIFEGNNDKLKEIMKKTFNDETGFEDVVLDGEDYYVVYGNGVTSDWAIFMFVSRKEVEAPTNELLASMEKTNQETLQGFGRIFRHYSIVIMLVIVLLVFGAAVAALLFSRRLTVPIDRMTDKVHNISGDSFTFEMDEAYRTGDEIEVLAGTFEELSDRTRDYIKEITEITAEKERIGAELDVAHRIQADMLPKNFPVFPDRKEFDLYANMDPAKEVGGDFYDMFLIDPDHLCMVVGDVAGKGVPAALFMVISKTMIKNRAQMGGKPSEILEEVNNSLSEGNDEMMFVTVWLGILTISTGELITASAGHEYPVIRKNGEEYKLIETENGMVLGAMKRMKYNDVTFTLGAGDCFFMYTDGLPEATNSREKRFENDGMMKAINRHKDEEPVELLRTIREEVDDFVEDAPQFDDLTMLILRYNGLIKDMNDPDNSKE